MKLHFSLLVLIVTGQAVSQNGSEIRYDPSGRSIMGSIFSLLGVKGLDPEDPVTGLTSKEIKLIKTSYSKLMESAIENGMTIMLQLFDRYPQYKGYFPFRDIPIEKLSQNAAFKVHCSRIMYNLREVVDNLDNAELVIAMLDKIASNHKKHQAPAQGFQDIREVILDIIASLFSSDTVDAWRKLLEVAMDYISKQLS